MRNIESTAIFANVQVNVSYEYASYLIPGRWRHGTT